MGGKRLGGEGGGVATVVRGGLVAKFASSDTTLESSVFPQSKKSM